jgi:hypothetical protein
MRSGQPHAIEDRFFGAFTVSCRKVRYKIMSSTEVMRTHVQPVSLQTR